MATRSKCAPTSGPSRIPKAPFTTAPKGVGPYRTEFRFMDRDALPTEDEQFKAYKEVAEAMPDQPIIVRTMDIGGDKELPLHEFPERDESLPGLACRAYLLLIAPTSCTPSCGHPPCVCLRQTAHHVPDDHLRRRVPQPEGYRGDAESRTACREGKSLMNPSKWVS